jgi:hypothetical protein
METYFEISSLSVEWGFYGSGAEVAGVLSTAMGSGMVVSNVSSFFSVDASAFFYSYSIGSTV